MVPTDIRIARAVALKEAREAMQATHGLAGREVWDELVLKTATTFEAWINRPVPAVPAVPKAAEVS